MSDWLPVSARTEVLGHQVLDHPVDEDLLCLLDGELAEPLSGDIERHLAGCAPCAERQRVLADVAYNASALYRARSAPAGPADMRDRLLDATAAAGARAHARWAPISLALTAALVFLIVHEESALLGKALQTVTLQRRALPIAAFTPGATRSIALEDVCRVGAPRVPPPVSDLIRRQVLRDYGMEHVPEHDYELDYLITPELGGLPERRNLWPELYGSHSWNAHAKDALEHALPQLVCEGRIDLMTAQREIATDWIAAYKKYLATDRPVQLHARLLDGPPGSARDW